MTSDRWRPSPEVARAIEEFLRRDARPTDDPAPGRIASAEPDHPSAEPAAVGIGADADPSHDSHIYDACPELGVLIDLLGTAEAAHEVAALLVEVTVEDIADLDGSIASCDFDRAALRLHRIVGGYQILGSSLLVDEGRALLAELRTARSGATLARLCRFRERLSSMMGRIEKAVALQRDQRLLRA